MSKPLNQRPWKQIVGRSEVKRRTEAGYPAYEKTDKVLYDRSIHF